MIRCLVHKPVGIPLFATYCLDEISGEYRQEGGGRQGLNSLLTELEIQAGSLGVFFVL